MPGGDFRNFLNRFGVLTENDTRFYCAQMAIAVDQVHQMGYIHRDIKPENFLITTSGNLKLTDFGLSHGMGSNVRLDNNKIDSLPTNSRDFTVDVFKQYNKLEHRAFSLVGSPDYIAIEIVENSIAGYDYAVDYWSIGCLMFECLTGYPPFTSRNIDDVWTNVRNWQKVLKKPINKSYKFNHNMSNAAWDLISQLIINRKFRIDSLIKLQLHPFFHHYNALEDKAPFIPKISYSTDTRHFDDFSNDKDMALYTEVIQRHKKFEQSDQETIQNDFRGEFIDFDYDYNL